jgi:zinc transporter, ZIP family
VASSLLLGAVLGVYRQWDRQVCALATIAGYAVSRLIGDRFTGAVDGFAAGALLVMLVGSMVPEAKEKAAIGAGLAAVLGYAAAAGLSVIS